MDGVTRVDRKWVQLTVKQKNIVGPIPSKQEEDIVGLVTYQKDHCKSLFFSTCVLKGADSNALVLVWCVLQFLYKTWSALLNSKFWVIFTVICWQLAVNLISEVNI